MQAGFCTMAAHAFGAAAEHRLNGLVLTATNNLPDMSLCALPQVEVALGWRPQMTVPQGDQG